MTKQPLPDFLAAINADIARNIQRLKIERDFTNTRIGEVMGVTHQQVSKYLNGQDAVSGARLKALANYAKVKTEYFFRSENEA